MGVEGIAMRPMREGDDGDVATSQEFLVPISLNLIVFIIKTRVSLEPTTDNPRSHHHAVASTPPNSGLLAASLTSVSSLVFLQLFSRIFTFVLNQTLVRLATPQTFGTATVQFELLLSTTLFLSREGVRTALLRQRKTVPPDLARNIALLPAYVGTPIAVALAVLCSVTSASAVCAQQHFHLSVSIYVFTAALKLAAEPLYIRAQNELRVDVRARGGSSRLAFAPPAWALVAFAAGQAASALATFAVFWNLLWVVTVAKGDNIPPQSAGRPGGYAIASDYGLLVARVVFQPIEETSHIFFSKSLSSSPSSSSSKDDQEALETAVELLSTLLLFTHFLLLIVFGPRYLPLATALVLPPRYQQTSAPRILRAFRFYLPAMAYSGVLEAFLASVCTPADLRAQSRMMAAASAALIATAPATRHSSGPTPQAWPFCQARAVLHRRAAPAARRARSVCSCRSLDALERRCACRCPVVAVGAALARCAGRCLSRRLSRRVLRLGAAPVPEDDRSFEEEPEVTRIGSYYEASGGCCQAVFAPTLDLRGRLVLLATQLTEMPGDTVASVPDGNWYCNNLAGDEEMSKRNTLVPITMLLLVRVPASRLIDPLPHLAASVSSSICIHGDNTAIVGVRPECGGYVSTSFVVPFKVAQSNTISSCLLLDAICFYDWVISLDQEVAFIYPAPWNGVKTAYIFCRYYPMAIAPFHLWGVVGNHEESVCESYYHVLYACAMPTLLSAQCKRD
ncbi:Rft protein-domain-containing protein [Lactarius deliciosus]|nr:Rft protein-domain-containing protein [Lactarius deliciosus]